MTTSTPTWSKVHTILTDKERERLQKVGGCFYCCKIGYIVSACPNKEKWEDTPKVGPSRSKVVEKKKKTFIPKTKKVQKVNNDSDADNKSKNKMGNYKEIFTDIISDRIKQKYQ